MKFDLVSSWSDLLKSSMQLHKIAILKFVGSIPSEGNIFFCDLFAHFCKWRFFSNVYKRFLPWEGLLKYRNWLKNLKNEMVKKFCVLSLYEARRTLPRIMNIDSLQCLRMAHLLTLTLPRFMNFRSKNILIGIMNFDSLQCLRMAQTSEFDLTAFYEFDVKKLFFPCIMKFDSLQCLRMSERCEFDLTAFYEFYVKK